MMLRSSSTPILSSLISSYSESPNHNHHSEFNSPKNFPRKLSFHQIQTCPLNLITPSSPSINGEPTQNPRNPGLRRVQSEGNLEGLASASCNTIDELNNSILPKKFPRKPNCSVLQTIPSFSVHNHRSSDEEDEEEEEEEEDRRGDLSLGESMAFMNNSGLQKRHVVEGESENLPSKMHLAVGFGASSSGFNGGGGGHNEWKAVGYGGDGGDGAGMEEYYKRMVEENPGNPLFLRNYAQFLHQAKKDLGGAEEYYSRAILVDPGDGDVLSQYAQLTWELHGDQQRASSYFQQAVQAAPQDCHVLAAYAGFLWETEEDDDDGLCTVSPLLHQSAVTAANT